MYTKIAPVLINAEQKNHSVVQLFLAEPNSHEEKWAGTLFALLEIETKKNQAHRVIDFIIGALNSHYYQNEKISLREKIPTLKVENIFETALVKVNQDLLDFLARERIDLSPKQISATIGIIYQDQLHFSNIGKSQALLLHQDQDDRYHLINVEKNEARPEKYSGETLSFKKLFSSIISGEMPPKSYFLFANEALAEYLFNRELIEIVTKLAPSGAAEQIKNTLEKINPYVPFAGLIIKNNAQVEADNFYPQVTRPTRSLDQAETETEKIMTTEASLSNKKMINLGPIIIWPFQIIGRLLSKLFSFSKRDKASELIGLENKPLKGARIGAPKRKTLKIIIGICLLLLLVSLGAKKMNLLSQNNNQEAKKYEETILQKENQIDSYLLYNDEKSAEQILVELKTILESIPKKVREKINNFDQLQATYEKQKAQLEHVTPVSQQEEWFNFSSLDANWLPENLSLVDGFLLAADSDSHTIKQINLSNKAITSLEITGANDLSRRTVSKDNSAYYSDGQQIWKINGEKISTTTISLSGELSAIDTYNNKLYVLAKPQNQVYRYALDPQNNWTGGESRIKGVADFQNVNSWSIDNSTTQGAIYLLRTDGQVLKYFDGQKQDFSLAAAEPVFDKSGIIRVAKNIYILDPSNKRLLIFSKEGKFINQYQSEQFNSLTDFAVDRAEKTIYLLSGQAIYQIKL